MIGVGLTDEAEMSRIKHNMAVIPHFITTTTRAIAKQLLLDGWFFCQGHMRKPVVKHVGLGVYEVTSERFDP